MEREAYENGVGRVLISANEIREKVAEAGRFIDSLYDGRPVLLVSILKGAFIFLADLARAVTVPCEIAFMSAQSYYSGTESSGEVTVTMDLGKDISGYHVVIVEDIIDTGRTLAYIAGLLRLRAPLSLNTVTLLDKPDRRVTDFKADFSLFTIPDYFVIGYGLDFGEYYRNLPYIAEFDQSKTGQQKGE